MNAVIVFLIPSLLIPAVETPEYLAPASRFCSIMVGGELMSDGVTLFIGTSTNDSLPADRVHKDGRFMGKSYSVSGPPYSQVMHVERLSTKAPASVRNALKSAGNRVLVIPWSYGPDCGVATYEGSALWVRPVTRALFGATLRPRGDWVNDIPTFDTGHPRNTPYPIASGYDRERAQRDVLSPDEMLSFADSIPRYRTESSDVATRYLTNKKRWEATLRWAAGHPNQSDRWPLSDYVAAARSGIATAAFDTIISPVAGTYRFVIDIPGQDSIVFFGRTTLRPATMLQKRHGVEMQRGVVAPHGYYLLVCAAESIASLPATSLSSKQGFLAVSIMPVLRTRDSTVWDGAIDLLAAASEIPGNSSLKSVRKEIDDHRFSRYRSGSVDLTPGRIVRLPDGSIHASHALNGNNSVVVSIRGTRVSKQTLNDR